MSRTAHDSRLERMTIPPTPVTESGPKNWLALILATAKNKHWCRSIGCTTCGCSEFRVAVFSGAMERLSMDRECAQLAEVGLREFMRRLGPADRNDIKDEILSALSGLSTSSCQDVEALEVIAVDCSTGIGRPPLKRLDGSPAGSVLRLKEAQYRIYSERSRKAAIKHDALMEVEQEAARKRREIRALESEAHARRKVENDLRITPLLEAFRLLDLQGRLEFLCSESCALPLSAIPKELIPTDAVVANLDELEVALLRKRIGKRKGSWRTLQRRLDGE